MGFSTTRFHRICDYVRPEAGRDRRNDEVAFIQTFLESGGHIDCDFEPIAGDT